MSEEIRDYNDDNINPYQLFESIISNVNSIILIKNSKNKIVFCNDCAVKAFGKTDKKEIIDTYNFLNSLSQESKNLNFSLDLLLKSEQKITINDIQYSLYNLNYDENQIKPNQIESQKMPSDSITLLEERNRYYSLFQNSPFGLLHFNHKAEVIDCNAAFLELFGLEKDQCININLFEKLKDPKLLEALENMFKSGFGQYEDIYKSVLNGREIPVKIILKIIIEEEKPPGGIAIIINMAEKFKYEKIIQDSETKYKTIFNSINDAIFVQNIENGSILECNDKTCEMFKYSKDEILSKTINDLSENISPFTSEEAFEYINLTITSCPQVFNWRAKRKDHSLFWVEVNMRTVIIDNEKRIIVVLKDITEKIKQTEIQDNLNKQLEDKAKLLLDLNNDLKKTESELITISENKDKFYSTITTDLKSPFLSILGYTEFLDNNLEKLTSSEIKDSLVSLNLAISNVYTLIERLLEWSRTQSGEFSFHPEHLKLAEIFDSNIDILIKNANYKNIRIVNEISAETIVNADEYMLSSVIRNLVGNAIKFSYINSSIHISSKRDGDNEVIMIEDFGVGIDPDTLPKLFDKKHHISTIGTYKEAGTGLGLLLCKDWIEKNNGKYWIKSDKQNGTISYFTLPVPKIKDG